MKNITISILLAIITLSTQVLAAGTKSGTEYNGTYTLKNVLVEGYGANYGGLRHFWVNETISNCTQ